LGGPRWSGGADALAWGDAVLAAIPDAIVMARELGETACAAELPHILMSYLNLRKPWAQWIAVCRAGLAARDAITAPELVANLRIALGIALRETQVLPEAVGEFSAALADFRRAGNTVGASMTLNNLATVYQQMGQPDRAREALLDAERELADSDDGYRHAIVLHNLSEAEIDLGRLDDALGHARRSLAAALDVRDLLGAATTRTTLGRIHVLQGEPGLAEAEFTASLAVQRDGGDLLGQATTARHLGQLLLERGRVAEAVTHLAEADRILTELGDPAAEQAADLLQRARSGAPSPAGRRRRHRGLRRG
jgi:tetratricopeptide (TPR) repeat protein